MSQEDTYILFDNFFVEGISVRRLVTATRPEIDRRYAAFARLSHFATQQELASLELNEACHESRSDASSAFPSEERRKD
ncbi:hypothetical protein HC928_17895 [bacterium]|nr:hypothetical protein [bacterium]